MTVYEALTQLIAKTEEIISLEQAALADYRERLANLTIEEAEEEL